MTADTASLEAVMHGGEPGRIEREASGFVGILVVDAKGKLVHVNRRISDLFNYSANELIGKPLSSIMPSNPDTGDEYWYQVWWAKGRAAKDMSLRQKIVGRRLDGSKFDLAVAIAPTTWYEAEAALITILPATWVGIDAKVTEGTGEQ